MITLNINRSCAARSSDEMAQHRKDLFPVTLWHASINKNSVCKHGLKTFDELGREGKEKVAGLGFGSLDAISFTYEMLYAIAIAHNMKILSMIANGMIDVNNIAERLDEIDVSRGMTKKPSKIFSEMNEDKEFKTLTLLSYPGFLDDLKDGFLVQNKKEKCLSDDEVRHHLFYLVKWEYFNRRWHSGGVEYVNVGSHYQNFKGKIFPDDIGVFEIEAYIPKPLSYYLTLKEYITNITWTLWDTYPNGKDKILFRRSEWEIRIHPKYTGRIDEICFDIREIDFRDLKIEI